MTDYIFMKDGKVVKVEPNHRDQVRSDLSERKDFFYKGKLIKYFEIKDASLGELEEVSPSLPELPEGKKKTTFWEKVLKINNERGTKPWIYAGAIEFAKRNTHFTEPEQLVEFIRAEWDSCKEHNFSEI